MKFIGHALLVLAGAFAAVIAIKSVEEYTMMEQKWQDAWSKASAPATDIL